MSRQPTFVYVIGQGDGMFMKVGITSNPKARLAELQTGNPYPLDMMHTRRMPSRDAARTVEARVHDILSDFHMSGEWFGCHYDDAIAAVDRAAGPVLVHG